MPEGYRRGLLLYWPGVSCIIEQSSDGKRDAFIINEEMAVYMTAMNEAFVKTIIGLVGGEGNISSVTNCMTRLRISVRDDGAVQDEALRQLPEVLAVNHPTKNYLEIVLGPGKARQCSQLLRDMGLADDARKTALSPPEPESADAGAKKLLKRLCRDFGRIFAPLIPGICAAGICAGLAALLSQLAPGYKDSRILNILFNLLTGVSAAATTYLTAWTGYRAAEVFGGTPILGGLMGMFTALDNVNQIAMSAGLFNEAQPLDSVLRTGRGGVLAVVIGVWFLCRVEGWIRKKLPDALDTVFAPLLTLLLVLAPYVFAVMPGIGLLSTGLCRLVSLVALSPYAAVRLLAGYVSAALFLPMVALGMHHGLIAIYALAMAGAGQVGAAAALAVKAKRAGNSRLCRTINGALPAGVLGVGEPLIYSVMLPLGKPLLTAGLGAGFGGAFVMWAEVASTSWGPSGLLGVFVMTEGPLGAAKSICCYLVGLAISAAAAFALTWFVIGEDAVKES